MIASTRIYNTAHKERSGKHWRQYSTGATTRGRRKFVVNPPDSKSEVKIEKLEKDLKKYKCANEKLKMIAGWNIRATQSVLKNSMEILEIVEDLYGEDAFESP